MIVQWYIQLSLIDATSNQLVYKSKRRIKFHKLSFNEMLKVPKTFSELLSETLNLIQLASDMYIRGDLKWLAGVVAGEAALSATHTSWLTPPARQAVALPAGRLAAVGVNTVASLQAARTERAHLHMWTDAKEEKSRQGSQTLRRTPRENSTSSHRELLRRGYLANFPVVGQ